MVADEVYGSDGKLRRGAGGPRPSLCPGGRRSEKPTTWPPDAPPGPGGGRPRLGPACRPMPGCGSAAEQGPGRAGSMTGPASRSAQRCARAGCTALLLRRHPTDLDEVASYLVYAPVGTPMGSRSCGRLAAGPSRMSSSWPERAGWARHSTRVRSWTGWPPPHDPGAASASRPRRHRGGKRGPFPPTNSSRISVPELRRLLNRLRPGYLPPPCRGLRARLVLLGAGAGIRGAIARACQRQAGDARGTAGPER